MRLSWIVLLSLVSAPALAEEKTVEPGLYEVVTTSAKGPADTTRVCVDAKDVARAMSPEVDKGCKRERSVVADGKLDFATSCPDTTMNLAGTYTSTGWALDGRVVVKGHGDDDPMTIQSHVTAKRIADRC